MRRGLGVAVALLALAGAVSACAGGHASPQGGGTTSPTGFIANGSLRCTATAPSSVQAGTPLRVIIRVKNVSNHTVNLPNPGGDLDYGAVVKAADGTTYDTRYVGGMGGFGPTEDPIAPGATVRPSDGGGVLVSWRGPLRVTPWCDTTPLAPLRVEVRSPGPPPNSGAAIAAVVGAAGHLLDHCRPTRPGVPVQGRIYPPGGNLPPMPATCTVRLRNEGRFLMAQAVILTPPGSARDVSGSEPNLGIRGSHFKQPWEVLVWDSVVTKNGATRVNAASEFDNTKHFSQRTASEWTLPTGSGSHWQYDGHTICGGYGSGGSLILQFITSCPR